MKNEKEEKDYRKRKSINTRKIQVRRERRFILQMKQLSMKG